MQNLAGLGTVAIEEVGAGLAKKLGTLAPGPQRGVEGEMAQQIERVGIGLFRRVSKLLEADTTFGQPTNDCRPLHWIGPLRSQFRRRGEQCANCFRRVLGVADYPQLLAV